MQDWQAVYVNRGLHLPARCLSVETPTEQSVGIELDLRAGVQPHFFHDPIIGGFVGKDVPQSDRRFPLGNLTGQCFLRAMIRKRSVRMEFSGLVSVSVGFLTHESRPSPGFRV